MGKQWFARGILAVFFFGLLAFLDFSAGWQAPVIILGMAGAIVLFLWAVLNCGKVH